MSVCPLIFLSLPHCHWQLKVKYTHFFIVDHPIQKKMQSVSKGFHCRHFDILEWCGPAEDAELKRSNLKQKCMMAEDIVQESRCSCHSLEWVSPPTHPTCPLVGEKYPREKMDHHPLAPTPSHYPLPWSPSPSYTPKGGQPLIFLRKSFLPFFLCP